MEQLCAGQVCKKHTERNRQQKKRFKAFGDSKIHQYADDNIHDQRFVEFRIKSRGLFTDIINHFIDTGRFPQLEQIFKHV